MSQPTTPATDPTCIFCKIIAGSIPSHRVYEDERVVAFLDVAPLAAGHVLVVPRAHAARLDDLSPADAGACAAAAARVGAAVVRHGGAAGWNLLQNNGAAAGQVVMHVHFHVIPRREGDGLGYRWPAGKLDGETAASTAAAIRDLIRG